MNHKMQNYPDLASRREFQLMKRVVDEVRSEAIALLREARSASFKAGSEVKTGDKKKVERLVYEAVIASASKEVTFMANRLRSIYGTKSKH